MRNAFCPFCGLVLGRVVEVPSSQMVHEKRPWHQEVRAGNGLVRSRPNGSPSLTGVGYINEFLHLSAHPDEGVHYTDPAQGWETYPLRYKSGQSWVFAFHDACWTLLLERVADREAFSISQTVFHLFNILYSTPCDKNSVWVPGHDYGGVTQFQYSYGNIRPILQSPSWLFLLSDPLESVDYDITKYLKRASLDTTSTASSGFLSSSVTGADLFSQLPKEIIAMVLANLPSIAVCNLRLTSRTVAAISDPTQLPNTFWASRFEKEFEMGFFFRACQKRHKMHQPLDWRLLYLSVKEELDEPRRWPSLKNKRRIWNELQDTATALRYLLKTGTPTGYPAAESDLSWLPKERLSDSQPRIGPRVPNGVLSGNRAAEELRAGGRILNTVALLLPPLPTAGATSIGVSFISINTRLYVCGLRFRRILGSGVDPNPSAAGFIIPSTEEEILLESQEWIAGMEVAVSLCGIIGLRFFIRGPMGPSAHSIGDLDSSNCITGIGTLFTQPGGQPIALIIGLDACKFICMQIVKDDCEEYPNEATIPGSEQPADCFLQADNLIWSPTFPSPNMLLTYIPKKPSDQSLNVNLNIDFGGPKGARLRSLQRVVAFMFNQWESFLGFAFYYSDGSSVFYGRRSAVDRQQILRHCIEQSFLIDTDGGEIISKVDVEYDDSDDRDVTSLKLYTNKGACIPFHLHPFLRDDPFQQGNNPKSYSLSPPEGTVITGLLAVPQMQCGFFRTFGIQSQRVDYPVVQQETKPNSPIPLLHNVTIDSPDTGCHIIFGRGTAFTKASLVGVRYIGVACGEQSRSRNEKNISGLWLDYHDSIQSTIVGQWIEPFDSLEFALGESLTEITVWTAPEFVNQVQGHSKLGRVVGMRFATSFGNSKQILMDDISECVCLQFQASYFEELAGITWAFNYAWDHVRVLSRRSANQGAVSLIALGHGLPRWIVPTKLLWRDDPYGGEHSSVAFIQVTWSNIGIAGISFIFHSGITRTMGSEGENKDLICLDVDERLTRIDVGYRPHPHHMQFITFHTDRGRSKNFGLRSQKKDSEPPNEVYLLQPGQEIPDHDQPTQVYEAPVGSSGFAGLWGLPTRVAKAIFFFGPIFVGARSDEEGEELYSVFPVPKNS